MFSRVSLVCFAASYAIAFGLELLRAMGKVKVSAVWVWMWMLAGLVAHTAYLFLQAKAGLALRGAPLSNWYHWCLIGAWIVAFVTLLISFARPKSAVGLFLLPLVLGLIGLGRIFPKNELFSASEATRAWGLVHGISLLVGTVSVLIGFATGIMYLVQSRQLKNKVPPSKGIRLPSLEWLEHANERSLLYSTFFLVLGLLAGIVLNLVNSEKNDVNLAWNDPTVWISALLFGWLVAVTTFSIVYKPARTGRKVAYLTVANFIILALTLGMVLFGPSDHADSVPATAVLTSFSAMTIAPFALPVAIAQRMSLKDKGATS